MTFLHTNCGDPDQTPITAASALGLHRLPTSKQWSLCWYWLDRTNFCKQTVETLIRRRLLRRPLWVYIVCLRANIGLANIGLLVYICMEQVEISARKLWRLQSDAAECGVRSWSTFFAFVKILNSRLILARKKLTFLQADCGDPVQTPLIAATAPGLYCLPKSEHLTLGFFG